MQTLESLNVIQNFSISAEPTTDAFPIGTERSYTFINDVTISHKKGGKNIGYRLNGLLKVGAIWGTDEHKFLKFHLKTLKLQTLSEKTNNYIDQPSTLDGIVDVEFYAIWHVGKITKTFFSKKEDSSVINLKKALISLFQYQLMDGRYVEDDVSGNCDVTYRTISINRFEKMKTNCKNDDLEFHAREATAIGVSVVSWRSSDYFVTQDGTLDKVESREYHEIAVNAIKNAGKFFKYIRGVEINNVFSRMWTGISSVLKIRWKHIKYPSH